MSECKHHYKICGRCQNPLVCNICGKTRGQVYEQRISKLEQQLAELREASEAVVAERCEGIEKYEMPWQYTEAMDRMAALLQESSDE